jgi:hypothetical protein
VNEKIVSIEQQCLPHLENLLKIAEENEIKRREQAQLEAEGAAVDLDRDRADAF